MHLTEVIYFLEVLGLSMDKSSTEGMLGRTMMNIGCISRAAGKFKVKLAIIVGSISGAEYQIGLGTTK